MQISFGLQNLKKIFHLNGFDPSQCYRLRIKMDLSWFDTHTHHVSTLCRAWKEFRISFFLTTHKPIHTYVHHVCMYVLVCMLLKGKICVIPSMLSMELIHGVCVCGTSLDPSYPWIYNTERKRLHPSRCYRSRVKMDVSQFYTHTPCTNSMLSMEGISYLVHF